MKEVKVKLVVLRQKLSPEFLRLRKAAKPYEEFLAEHGVPERNRLTFAAILVSPGRKTRVEHLEHVRKLEPSEPIPDVVTKLARALDARGGL